MQKSNPKPTGKQNDDVPDFTQIKSEEEKQEYFDPPDLLDEKVTLLAELILESKHTVFFTGAGISTSTGIPDYRSGYGTKLEIGPGCWEKAAYRKKHEEESKALKPRITNMQKAYPSLTHMAIVELFNNGLGHHVVSQNVDGLHRKSGIKPDQMSELHGNYNLEFCVKCGKEYMRDYHTYCPKSKHITGRKCDNPKCRGDLKDSVINFGEPLVESIIKGAFAQGEKADLHICMGSSLRVTPACDIPVQTARNGGDMVIINLQKTPLDQMAFLCIYAMMDDVMALLMQKLELPIPVWKKKVRLQISQNGAKGANLTSVDSNGSAYEIFTSVKYNSGQDVSTFTGPQMAQTSKVTFPSSGQVSFTCKFLGHYHEPDLTFEFDVNLLKNNSPMVEILMLWDSPSGKWEQVICNKKNKDGKDQMITDLKFQ